MAGKAPGLPSSSNPGIAGTAIMKVEDNRRRKEFPMRRIAPLLLLLLASIFAGCKNTTGPLASKQRPQTPDPLYNSEQKQAFVRERYPLPEDNRNVAPITGLERFDPTGR
jgi:hypothetical protein